MTAWADTGVCIVRSQADPRVWSVMVPELDMMSIAASASGLRTCKAWVEGHHRQHVYGLEVDTPTRWVQDGVDLWEWQARVR